ncbi:hypothetical protein [Olleya marilimosa]|uniref:hypothetical protein n=1 Tax=Olleya marilimosa TaxID=272164 RepID=UPI0030EC1448
MKKVLQLIFIVIGLTSCKAQEVDGIWMSIDDRVIDEHHSFSSGMWGMIIDFDKSEIKAVLSDSTYKFEKRHKEIKIVHNIDYIVYPYEVFKKDSIEIEIVKNTITVFKRLNFDYPLESTKSEIVNFLTDNCVRKFGDSIEVKFSKNYHPLDKNKELRMTETIWNNSRPLVGNWSIGEINKNFFIFISIDDTTEENIYQITSISGNTLKLKPIKENYYELTELKTCL